MTRRHTIAGFLVAALTVGAVIASVPAAAHHTGPGGCLTQGPEMGIWTMSDRARSGLTHREQIVDAKVTTPPATDCQDVWYSSWWQRTSTNYNVIPSNSTIGDAQDQRQLVNFQGFQVNNQADYINGRVQGRLVPPVMESVNLYVITDNGVRVWLDGNLVIDEWHDHTSSTTYWYATPVLSPSMEHPVVIEYYHKTGSQNLQFYWKTTPTGIVMPNSIDLNGLSSQHSSLHATDVNQQNCVETVAYRDSNGDLTIWGYGCGSFETTDSDPEFVPLGAYQPQWITLYQVWNGPNVTPSSWGHWYYRWDLNKWYYIGNTGTRPADMLGWLESSGYNVNTPRGTTFNNYKEGNISVDFTICPETADVDPHQAMDPVYSGIGASFYPASNAQDMC